MNKLWNYMSNIIIIIILLTYSSLSQSFYDINTIQKIEITFKQSNWDYMLDTAKAGSDGYLLAESMTINGTKVDSVGVKFKGNSTYNRNRVKNSFHISLDKYKDQNYQGYKDIKLSNSAKDPSFIREVLSYHILRQYMDASLSNYANIYVNGELIGLYVNCESIGKKFVKDHFFSKNSSFFKCNPIRGAGPGRKTFPNLAYLGSDSTSYMEAYEIKSDFGWSDLINLCYTLKNNFGDIEKVLNVDRVLWMLAFDNIVVNLDSYIGVFSQNYYLYKDKTGRFNPVLWDFNESFGTFSQSGSISLTTTTAKSQMSHLLHEKDANWILIQKILADPTYRRMYLAHYQTILNENFTNNTYFEFAKSLQNNINAAVEGDPNKFYTYSQYQTNLTEDVSLGSGGMGGSTAPGITKLMNARCAYLATLKDFAATRPDIKSITVSDTNPKLNSKIKITADVSNANTDGVYLGFRLSKSDKFTKILMYDDGAHNDGAPADHIFGATINVAGNIDYYIYAENTAVGVFSPSRAEHEFYSVHTQKK